MRDIAASVMRRIEEFRRGIRQGAWREAVLWMRWDGIASGGWREWGGDAMSSTAFTAERKMYRKGRKFFPEHWVIEMTMIGYSR
jgi:hypothetical protein